MSRAVTRRRVCAARLAPASAFCSPPAACPTLLTPIDRSSDCAAVLDFNDERLFVRALGHFHPVRTRRKSEGRRRFARRLLAVNRNRQTRRSARDAEHALHLLQIHNEAGIAGDVDDSLRLAIAFITHGKGVASSRQRDRARRSAGKRGVAVEDGGTAYGSRGEAKCALRRKRRLAWRGRPIRGATVQARGGFFGRLGYGRWFSPG